MGDHSVFSEFSKMYDYAYAVLSYEFTVYGFSFSYFDLYVGGLILLALYGIFSAIFENKGDRS